MGDSHQFIPNETSAVLSFNPTLAPLVKVGLNNDKYFIIVSKNIHSPTLSYIEYSKPNLMSKLLARTWSKS